MAMRIMLCEDETHILRALEFKFKRAGFDVEGACDGEDAWKRIQRRRPDFLITDCQMPRLDGLGLLERLRSEPATADLPVLMLTAKGYELSRQQLAERYGVLDVLLKPFSPRDLVKRVEAMIQELETPVAAASTLQP